ncbi:hypothetical protein [Streptomyces jeddahensis]|uniref:Nudix hydrolase domain-containing protein n=1 Tax=Streptomyces jeddahensis TaxID=1716141 RepID=A0A177HUZ2_9ACTN|nr:hypothetical protein [Streptomyces jeddahensis]OAH14034.1 hypothetical protein STSP_24820 [Streptomyces jeddahensis]
MDDVYVPWPRFDRRVFHLLLDEQQRLLLCGACCRGWTVPQVRLDSGADYLGQATRFLQERFGLRDPRFSALYGLHQSRSDATWESDHPTPSRVFIVHITDEQAENARNAGHSHALWPVPQLRRRRREVFPEGVALLTAGYTEGWLPDGPIELS